MSKAGPAAAALWQRDMGVARVQRAKAFAFPDLSA